MTLYLNPRADRRLKLGHLWIYSNEVNTQRSPLKSFEAGSLVQVSSHSGQALGQAFVHPNALLCGRLVSRDVDEAVDEAFFVKRFTRALQLRERCFAEPYYRLVYGDSDDLPGLVVDRFGDHLVAQVSVAGMAEREALWVSALQTVLPHKGMLICTNHSANAIEQLAPETKIVGDMPDRIEVLENTRRFEIDPLKGQKTGWFYDHRLNRARLQAWVANSEVLDVFSYLGGWGIQAAAAGASKVTCVDASQSAIDGVLKNAELNRVQNKVSALKGKAVDVLKQLVQEKTQFDCVVLDPPAFIKKRKDQKSGEAAYRHLNELALRLLRPGGLLVSASCSMTLQASTLTDIVHAAARHQHRSAQLIYTGAQGPDHPVHPMIPETAYLKALFFRV